MCSETIYRFYGAKVINDTGELLDLDPREYR